MAVDDLPTNALFAPSSSIMRPRSFHRGENCTDVALALIAAGGCRSVSAGVLARHLGVTPAAVLKWFGSTAAMWDEIAACIGRRWYSHVEWTRVWLSMLELGRHQELVGKRMAQLEARELEVLYRATGCRDVPTLTDTMVVVRGLRQMVTSTHDPMALPTAHDLLARHVRQVYVEQGVPEPADEDDVLSVTRRMAYAPARRPDI